MYRRPEKKKPWKKIDKKTVVIENEPKPSSAASLCWPAGRAPDEPQEKYDEVEKQKAKSKKQKE